MSPLIYRLLPLGLLTLMVGCTQAPPENQASPSPSAPPVSIVAPINRAKTTAKTVEQTGKQLENANPEAQPDQSPSPSP